MNDWGPVETVKASELAVGDFVISRPAQSGMGMLRINSGVRDIRDDFGHWRFGPPRRRYPIKSRIIMFNDPKISPINIPASEVLDAILEVRRKLCQTTN